MQFISTLYVHHVMLNCIRLFPGFLFAVNREVAVGHGVAEGIWNLKLFVFIPACEEVPLPTRGFRCGYICSVTYLLGHMRLSSYFVGYVEEISVIVQLYNQVAVTLDFGFGYRLSFHSAACICQTAGRGCQPS